MEQLIGIYDEAFRKFEYQCRTKIKDLSKHNVTYQDMRNGSFMNIQGAILTYIALKEKKITSNDHHFVTRILNEEFSSIVELDRFLRSQSVDVFVNELVSTYQTIKDMNEKLMQATNGAIKKNEYVITYIVMLTQLRGYIRDQLHVESEIVNQVVDELADRCADAQIADIKTPSSFDESMIPAYRLEVSNFTEQLRPFADALLELGFQSEEKFDLDYLEWIQEEVFAGLSFEYVLETICHADDFFLDEDAELLSLIMFSAKDDQFCQEWMTSMQKWLGYDFDFRESGIEYLYRSVCSYDQFLESTHPSHQYGSMRKLFLDAVEGFASILTTVLPHHQKGAEEVRSNINVHRKKLREKERRVALDAPDHEDVEQILQEFNALVGLAPIKQEISKFLNLVRTYLMRKERNIPTPPLSLHMVFLGNPGTGKTTVARYIGRVLKSLGLLRTGHLVETDRSGLVAGYVGQTALKVNEIVARALGGVLFIDEAYSLARGGEEDFGREAIEILIKRMEDHKDDICVIVAGYPEEMKDFLRSNSGLQSRFNRYIEFTDYTSAELLEIFLLMCTKYGYVVHEEAAHALLTLFETMVARQDQTNANGRLARNLFEKVISNQSDRIVLLSNPTDEELMRIIAEDIQVTEYK